VNGRAAWLRTAATHSSKLGPRAPPTKSSDLVGATQWRRDRFVFVHLSSLVAELILRNEALHRPVVVAREEGLISRNLEFRGDGV
jgi:hypothetical protein